jgi:two-component system, NtrC family, response regulator HydG
MQEQGNDVARANSAVLTGSLPAARILVIDDEPDTCEALSRILQAGGYDATPETSALSALERCNAQDFDLVLTDVSMGEMNGLELCQHIIAKRPGLPIILLTGHGSMQAAIAALRFGASDFLTKPWDAQLLVGSVARALRQRASAQAPAHTPDRVAGLVAGPSTIGLVGESPPIRALYELITNLSGSVASIIIQGETGTGKEIVARTIHDHSRLKNGPFIATSCAAIPAGLLESELFGHVRGAFTDARSARTGLLVQANGGTFLLDEIGELPLAMQPKLLRALQERKVRPIGGHQEVPFDCRVIAATNRNLDVEVAAKRFREDLYYRLDVVRITVPPLRERGEDVLLLARYFLQRLAKGQRAAPPISAAAAQKLLGYGWPGNVRELENCMQRAVTLCRRSELGVEDLPDKIRLADRAYDRRPAQAVAAPLESLRDLERRHILQVVERYGGNKTLAAELLGIDRSTLYRRLDEYAADDSN